MKVTTRRNIIRISLVILLIILGYFLFIVGKQHKIYIDNKTITIDSISYKALETYRVWVDDEEVGDIQKGKRKVVRVTGTNHQVVIQAVVNKKPVGEQYEKTFKLKVNEDAVINIPALINGLEQWLTKTDL